MTLEEKLQIKEKIIRTLDEIRQDILRLKEATQPISPDNAIGRVSRMDAINNKSVAEAGLRAAQSRLQKLERNLVRIEEETFGLCTRCGTPIQVKRLLFMPETSWCVRCSRKG